MFSGELNKTSIVLIVQTTDICELAFLEQNCTGSTKHDANSQYMVNFNPCSIK